MPRDVGYNPEDKVQSIYDMDKFAGLEKNEKRRVCLMQPKAKVAVIHWIDGTGYVECHGDWDVVQSGGVADPDNCLACKHAREGRGQPVGLPQRKFVTHLIEYGTNAKGKVITPVQVRLKAWVFGNDKHTSLVDIKEELDEGDDLRKHDLVVTCTEKSYQRFNIVMSQKCLWRMNADLKKRVLELWKEEHREDIDRLLGRVLSVNELKIAVERALPQAEVDDEEFVEETETLSDSELGDLLTVDESDDESSLDISEEEDKKQTTKAKAKAKSKKVEPVAEDVEVEAVEEATTADEEDTEVDFDDILDNLE